MRHRLLRPVLALFFASFLTSCVSGGSIQDGSKYGVRIGMTFEEANTILERRGMQRFPPLSGFAINPMCGLRTPQPGETIVDYSRNGNGQPPVSCLFTREGRVTAIAWEAF